MSADPTDRELVSNAVRNVGRLNQRRPRWAHVTDALGVGSTRAADLCRRFALDPDEIVGLAEETEEKIETEDGETDDFGDMTERDLAYLRGYEGDL